MTDAPFVIPIVVSELSIQVVTGDTCYAHENGFSTIYAKVTADDPQLAKRLSIAQKYGQRITLRGAGLDVTGKIATGLATNDTESFTLIIDDLTYRKPDGAHANA